MPEKQRILIVDDVPGNIKLLNDVLCEDYRVSVATSGPAALELAFSENRPDLILLDIMMPEMDGYEVCRRLKADERTKNLPVLFVSAMSEIEDEATGLELGAVDYITKPFSPPIVKQRVSNHMKLYLYREHLQRLVDQRTSQLEKGYIDAVHRLTLAAEYRDEETGGHIKRISIYTRELAEAMGMSQEFCESIYHASPMHDVGKVAIPDAVLLKPGPLNDEEWEVMKTHAEVGAKILRGSHSPYLQMAVDIARCHHERWDGGGYPAGLSGEEIPPTARIMSIADQYDALRSKRPYKPAFDHEKTLSIIFEGDGRTMPEHFDPAVLAALKVKADRFAEIFEKYGDDE